MMKQRGFLYMRLLGNVKVKVNVALYSVLSRTHLSKALRYGTRSVASSAVFPPDWAVFHTHWAGNFWRSRVAFFGRFRNFPHAFSKDLTVLPASANGMNHTCLCLPSPSWYSFTDPGGMKG